MIQHEHTDFIPDDKTRLEAQNSFQKLDHAMNLEELFKIRLQLADKHKTSVELSENLSRLLVALLEEVATGNPVSIFSLRSELTTQQAANMLNVSRPYFVKLLEEGTLPFHKVGKHRRVLAADVLKYKEHYCKTSDSALTQLVAEAQALNMGYKVEK